MCRCHKVSQRMSRISQQKTDEETAKTGKRVPFLVSAKIPNSNEVRGSSPGLTRACLVGPPLSPISLLLLLALTLYFAQTSMGGWGHQTGRTCCCCTWVIQPFVFVPHALEGSRVQSARGRRSPSYRKTESCLIRPNRVCVTQLETSA